LIRAARAQRLDWLNQSSLQHHRFTRLAELALQQVRARA
jgi:hypothetical protein